MSHNPVVSTQNAPAAVGPYAQARWAGDLLFISGQIGLDPKTGDFVPGGVQEQTRRVMNNLSALLKAAGLSWSNVVKATIFLTDMNDFAAVNEIYADFFKDSPHLAARACVAVSALPKGALVEIECIAQK